MPALLGGIGAEIDLSKDLRPDMLLFSESQSRFILTAASGMEAKLEAHFKAAEIPLTRIGITAGDRFIVRIDGDELINTPLKRIKEAYYRYLPEIMNK